MILITGGAGYIGSYVNKQLEEQGFETIIIDNLSSGGQFRKIKGIFIQGDFGDPALLEQLFSSYPIKAVMHFAALININESMENPLLYYENNVNKTVILLKKMREHQVNRMVFSSSAAIYGAPNEKMITEQCARNPMSPYGRTKDIIEYLLEECSLVYDFRFIALRYFNAAGNDPDGEICINFKKQHHLIPTLLQSLIDNTEITIYGNDYATRDGTCIRDYIHIADLAAAHLLALEKLLEGCPSMALNLGNGIGFSVNEVIQEVEKVTGKKVKAHIGPRRAGDPPVLLADATMAKRTLGWAPRYPTLEKIIKDAWSFARIE